MGKNNLNPGGVYNLVRHTNYMNINKQHMIKRLIAGYNFKYNSSEINKLSDGHSVQESQSGEEGTRVGP